MKRTLSQPTTPATLLFDGGCGLCAASARWLAERAPTPALRILPLANAAADPGIAPLVVGRDLASTLHVVTPDGDVLTGARAALAAARLVRGWGAIARLADHRLGHALLEPAYRRIAANRHRIGRRLGLPATMCAVPVVAASRSALSSCPEPTDRSVGR